MAHYHMVISSKYGYKTGHVSYKKSYIERLIWNEFGLEVISQQELLHWGTGRYLMNWIQVVCIKLKQIWPLVFSISKVKEKELFFNESKFQSKFGLEVSSQWKLLHWGTSRYLINGIQVVYFKLKEIWPLFSIAKAKKTGLFFFFFLNKSKSQSKFGLEVSSQWKLHHWGTGRYLMNWIQVVYFKLKEIWPLFAPAKAKKSSSFFISLPPNLWMKAWNLSPNLTLNNLNSVHKIPTSSF